MYDKLENLIVEFSSDPFNSKKNFEIAKEYERLNQMASAISFYLRAAEFSDKPKDPIVYASLLRLSLCFESQKDRIHTVSNATLQALAYDPERPEAYFLMSRFHERAGNYQECYTWAELGLQRKSKKPLPADVEYYGQYCLKFEKAVSGWWIGRESEAKQIFIGLLVEDLRPEYRDAIKANLGRIGVTVI